MRAKLGTLSFSDTIPLGKYKGRTVEEIIETDPGYLLWFITNIRHVTLVDEVKIAVKIAAEEALDDDQWYDYGAIDDIH